MLIDEECTNVIQNAWKESEGGPTPMQLVRTKLASCQTQLTCWSSRKFGNAKKKLKEKTKQLKGLQRDEGPANWEAIKQLQTDIDVILEHEDTKWKQRAKQNWYQQRDRNIPFFHA